MSCLTAQRATALVCALLMIFFVGIGGEHGPLAQEPTSEESGAEKSRTTASVDRRLARAQKLYDEQEYRRAIRLLLPIAQDWQVALPQRLQAFELIGLSYLILGDIPQAKEAFRNLIFIDPHHRLRNDTGSPKIRDLFEEVRREIAVQAAAGTTAALESTAVVKAGAPPVLEVTVRAMDQASTLKELSAFWRRRGEEHFRKGVLAPRGDLRWRTTISLPAARAQYAVEYYIEGYDIVGRVMARVGSPHLPLFTFIEPRTGSRPWYRRWYVIASGAALIGVATAVAVTIVARDDSEGSEGMNAPQPLMAR